MPKPASVAEYLKSLPDERRAAISKVRDVVNANLPTGYEEGLGFGMIAWTVPFSRFAETYNQQPLCLAALAAHKSTMTLYLMTVYGDPALRKWFESAWKAAGKKLDMGKSCLHFRSLDDLALDVVGEAIAKVSVDAYVAAYQASRSAPKKRAKKKTKRRSR